jgi:hypothetical protein
MKLLRLYELISISPSTRKNKRYVAEFSDGSKTHFGDSRYDNYTIHKNEEKKRRYILRHSKEDWTDPKKAGTLSLYILWNKPTLEASVEDYIETFGL